MHKVLRYIRQNRVKLTVMVLFIVFVYSIILTANDAYNEREKEKIEKKNEIITINADPSLNLSYRNCQNVINEFLELCINEKYEKAYTYLSKDCKENLYNSVESFKNNYCIKNSIKGKGYSVKKSEISSYVYTIEFNSMLSTGKRNSSVFYDYYTITVENGKDIKLNISSFLKTKKINEVKEIDGLTIKVEKCDTYKDYQEILVTFTNKNKNSVKIGKDVYVIDNNEKRFEVNNGKIMTIGALEEVTEIYTFYQYSDSELKTLILNNVLFSNSNEGKNIEIGI